MNFSTIDGRERMLRLKEMYVLGKDMTAEKWLRQAEDPAWRELFRGVVWRNGDRYLIPTEDGPASPAGEVSLSDEPLTPAHPVEMDAGEILRWEQFLKEMGNGTALQQLREPVVLRDGKLPGTFRSVESAGRSYEMLERYRGFRLPLSVYPSLQRDGFHFIVRQKWESHVCLDEVELVNIMTPAGIFYDSRPSGKMQKLQARRDRFLDMGLFYPFRNARLRTVNHVAATLEKYMLEQFAEKDRLDLLLPHLRTLPPSRIKQLAAQAPETGCAAFLREYCEGRERAR